MIGRLKQMGVIFYLLTILPNLTFIHVDLSYEFMELLRSISSQESTPVAQIQNYFVK